ncbi:Uncharacterised protein [Legionella wadsworthii]|uniref:Uncharacterized protein n=1 Tax=Legionella wadsworthii TaxID=28088 RepID=A0A378LQ79_9GAMM|nr:hypothetical protein [Legionella wadsworthii]STY27998.1 Uncharacterised protein [Legionella wadsworthii]
MSISSRYLLSLFSAVILLFLLWFGAVIAQLGFPTPSSQWVTELYKKKALAASHFKGTRIFIFGGSGTHFSVSAEKMSKELGIPTINYGTYGGLDIEYLLYKIKQVLRKGDIVLLAPEYTYYHLRLKYNEVYLDHISRDPEFLKTLTFEQQLQFALRISFKRIKLAYKEKFFKSKPWDQDPLTYVHTNYNAFGDVHSNNRIFITDHIRKYRDTSQLDGGIFGNTDLSDSWQHLQSFATWCKENGITVLATAPTHIFFDNIKNNVSKENIKKIKEHYAQLGIPFLGNPYQSMYDKSLYFDTVYHMNDLGKDLYSQRLIDLLKKELPHINIVKTQNHLLIKKEKNLLETVLKKFGGWEPIKGIELKPLAPHDTIKIVDAHQADIILLNTLLKKFDGWELIKDFEVKQFIHSDILPHAVARLAEITLTRTIAEPIKEFKFIRNIHFDLLPYIAAGQEEIILETQSIGEQTAILTSEILTNFDHGKVTIFLDDKPIWHHDYSEKTKDYYRLNLPIHLNDGKHVIKIVADKKNSPNAPQEKVALNFKSLRINAA